MNRWKNIIILIYNPQYKCRDCFKYILAKDGNDRVLNIPKVSHADGFAKNPRQL
jgi:hypothetical protein